MNQQSPRYLLCNTSLEEAPPDINLASTPSYCCYPAAIFLYKIWCG